ncbi:hypothetical protein DL93DRAFT_2155584 [Clavulina sp. PMI_390]|nr:hypothetical protein DL93DRAFT_2155584 [Clavulina sp. PMI_390]
MAGKENRGALVDFKHPVFRLMSTEVTPPELPRKPHHWPPGSQPVQTPQKRPNVRFRNKITQDAYNAAKRNRLVPNGRHTRSTRIVKLPSGISDASSIHWPKALARHADIPGRKGIFRIDDVKSNNNCSITERKRRNNKVSQVLEALGNGIEAYTRAELRGEPLEIKWEDGAPRTSHVSTAINGVDGFRIEHLPDGYAIFQTWGSDSVDELLRVRHDTYICGSAHVKEFRSTKEFIPHLYWLYTRKAKPCTCFWCSHHYTKGRPTTSK